MLPSVAPRPHWRAARPAFLLVAILLLLGMRGVAHATPPEPLWVAGFYDGCDFDDLVQPLASMMALTGDPDPLPASLTPGPEASPVSDVTGPRRARPAPADPRAPPAA
jgi:hypothetical protein